MKKRASFWGPKLAVGQTDQKGVKIIPLACSRHIKFTTDRIRLRVELKYFVSERQ